CTFKTKTN
nr:Chain P, KTKTN MOTIF [synthetic construct]2YNP_P Chain P, KTKTN MOTIF [synthetic construct]